MHAQIDEVFEIGGVIIARVRITSDFSRAQFYRCHLEQNGIVLSVAGSQWFEVLPSAPTLKTKKRAGRRVAASVSPSHQSGKAYLVAFGDAAVSQLSRDCPITVMVQADSAEIGRGSVKVSALDVARLQGVSFKSALCSAMQALGAQEIAAILNTSITVEPIENFGQFRVRDAIFANSGLILSAWISELAHRNIHFVTADIRCWVGPSQIARRPLERDTTETELAADCLTVPAVGSIVTAVLTTTGSSVVERLYLVEVDPSGAQATFYGPVTVTGSRSEQEAVRRVQEVFGPIQSLPRPLIQQVYRPLLALPKVMARARRFVFGPPVDETAPLSSIIIPFYGDAFFLNCVFHLQRVMGPGFELVLVVDDPRIWPEVYGRLSGRRSSITLPTTLLQCEENYGYARANNLGFRATKGDVIFLMNSDIMVVDPTVLRDAAETIRARRRAGGPAAIVGFTLLYEDDTIQHIGMEFPQSPLVGNMHLADHPMKGLPLTLYEGESTRKPAGVTGALMALSSGLYQKLEGFDAAYERGDFEDADLCLRAQQIGAEIQLHVRPGLYHLERQSIRRMGDADLREMITYMNCVEFNARWAAILAGQAQSSVETSARPVIRRRPISIRKRSAVQTSSDDLQRAGSRID
ncbi:glycosyltransferase [Microvirga tunisiensis]|uniref:Glycosyltransferase n=1 Tax=Microvirga tunisiensis TaxID=2108360 RepID=A0A5N7MJS4_9HYPH|nr:glycosyltransferase [Microvirga tunisiensis]MPR08705.1 glycosyltransferase [Microvirga tunisiensis]MPR26910.1 glycosyltransferase [Microvirga tunisiensis]